jgi:hypothetical protein
MQRSTMGRSVIVAAFGLIALGLAVDGASAGSRWQRAQERDYVVAESRYGNGTVSGPVRPSRFGYDVRLPGGTWVGCRRSCAETLRVETVDVFENEGRLVGYGTLQNECGIFGCLELHWPR